MKNKNNRTEIIKKLYLIELKSKDTYDDFLVEIKDAEQVAIIRKIRDDKIRHIELIWQLLEIF